MDERIINLEILRQRVQAAELAQGQLADYLDHGHPNTEQEHAALQDMARFREQAALQRETLSAHLAGMRAKFPQVVAGWVAWHASICLRILEEGTGVVNPDGYVTDQQVRQHVVKETLEDWQKVLVGLQDYVSINDAFLNDYDLEVRRAVEYDAPG